MSEAPLLPNIPSLESVTDPATRRALEAIKEIIEIGIGTRPKSEDVDTFVTFRDLYNSGIVAINQNGFAFANPNPDNSLITPIGESDLSTPPTPTGFEATGLFNAVFLEWDSPSYKNHAYTEIYRADTNNIGQAVLIATSVGFIYTDNITLTNATLWYWIRFVNKNNIKGEFNAINGTPATTSVDVNAILDLLDGQLSESALIQSLRERIDLIDDAGSITQSVTARISAEANARAQALINEANARGTAISNEATLRQNADNALAQSISLITASSLAGFDAAYMYNFDSNLEGWTAINATAVYNSGWIDLTPATADPVFRSPSNLNIQGSKYTTIKARIKRLAGSGWVGRVFYSTSGHGESGSFRKKISVPTPFNVGDTAIVEWDMTDLSAGGNDWVVSVINQIRIDLGNTISDVISIDWIAIGRNSPGASVAALEDERQARITGDSAEATARTALAAQINNPTTGLAAAHSAITTEQTARANAETALSSQITTVSSRISSRPNLCPDVDKWTWVWFNNTAGSGTTSIVNDTWGKWFRVQNPPNASFHIGQSPVITVEPNANYVITGDSMFTVGAGGSARCYFDIVMWDASNNVVLDGGQGVITTPHDFSNNDTHRLVHAVQVTAPANAATMRARFVVEALVNVTTVGFRQVKVERGTLPATPYSQEKDNSDLAVAIQTEATTRATQTGDIYAKYSVKIDANGYVSGFGLISTANNAAPSSEFAIVADKFSIAPVATSPTAADGSPFYYITTATVVNGVTIPAGAYMKRAFIADATIVTAHITDLAVNNAKIANLAVNDAKIASVSASKIITGTLQAGQSVTVGSGTDRIIIDGNGNIRAGATGFATGIGMWQGLDGGLYKMFLGSQTGENFAWDGANFNITGSLRNGQSAFGIGTGLFSGKNANGIQQVSIGDGVNRFIHWTGSELLIKSENINLTNSGLSINGTGTFSGALNAATGTFAGNLMAGVLNFAELDGVRQNFTVPGTYTITVPTGKTTMRFTICGGSGGGGAGSSSYNRAGGGGGGGGAKASTNTISGLTPGQTFTLVVGAKGIGGTGAGQGGTSGGATSISTLSTAIGGGGGGGGGENAGGAGGSGGNGGGAGGSGSAGYVQTVGSGMTATNQSYGGVGGAGGAVSGAGNAGGAGGGGAGSYSAYIVGQDGLNGFAYIEFFNPNSVVLQTSYNTLLSALTRQGIQIT